MAYKLVCWPNSIRIPVTNKEEECLFQDEFKSNFESKWFEQYSDNYIGVKIAHADECNQQKLYFLILLKQFLTKIF